MTANKRTPDDVRRFAQHAAEFWKHYASKFNPGDSLPPARWTHKFREEIINAVKNKNADFFRQFADALESELCPRKKWLLDLHMQWKPEFTVTTRVATNPPLKTYQDGKCTHTIPVFPIVNPDRDAESSETVKLKNDGAIRFPTARFTTGELIKKGRKANVFPKTMNDESVRTTLKRLMEELGFEFKNSRGTKK